jgi:hypothetical protein
VAALDDDHAIWRGPRGQQEAAHLADLRVDPPATRTPSDTARPSGS